jgi:glyoxylase-like metal-dependent hydrolase (beta-lactamase superfamily II)
VEDHVRALASRVETAEHVAIVLTHGHGDHAAAAPALSRLTGARVHGPEGLDEVHEILQDGDVVSTDAGDLVALHTPGHTPEHLSFAWADRDALFVGDLFLGQGDTTWVAEYSGCVADYLRSLERVREISPAVMYPTHGPPLEDPGEAIDRFESHRRRRIEQARRAMEEHPTADIEGLLDVVYGLELPDGLRGAARLSLGALVDYVRDGGTS